MKNLLKLSILIIVLTFVSCSSKSSKNESKSLPTLCECLTSKTNFSTGKECREVYKRVYGTSYPNAEQTTNDYFDCGGN